MKSSRGRKSEAKPPNLIGGSADQDGKLRKGSVRLPFRSAGARGSKSLRRALEERRYWTTHLAFDERPPPLVTPWRASAKADRGRNEEERDHHPDRIGRGNEDVRRELPTCHPRESGDPVTTAVTE